MRGNSFQIIIGLIIAAIYFISWIAKLARKSATKSKPAAQVRPPAPRPAVGDTDTNLSNIFRKLEQAMEEKSQTQVRPAQIQARPAPAPPAGGSDFIDLENVLPGAKKSWTDAYKKGEDRFDNSAPDYDANSRAFDQTTTDFDQATVDFDLQNENFEDSNVQEKIRQATLATNMPDTPDKPSAADQLLSEVFSGPDSIRRAILFNEILGRPRSMQRIR